MAMTTTEILMIVAYERKAAIAAERARCAAVCREVADIYRRSGCTCAECEGHREGARECAEEIECGEVGR
jgi:hypothetical protein